MIRVMILSYTEKGGQLNDRIGAGLRAQGDVALSFRYGEEFRDTGGVLAQEWRRTSAFVFVGAAGIAVRHIAPLLQSKALDPAVLVADENGAYVIPILSGHVGGGTALANRVAGLLGAQAVITTATDAEKRFAVDLFAVKNHLLIRDLSSAQKITSVLLKDKEITVHTGLPIEGTIPAGVRAAGASGADGLRDGEGQDSDGLWSDVGPDADVLRSGEGPDADGLRCGVEPDADGLRCGESPDADVLWDGGVIFASGEEAVCRLLPRPYVVGIGCRKGKSADAMAQLLDQVCERYGIDETRIAALASIDAKKEEEGIWELSRRLCVPYEVFTAQELAQIPDEVHGSEFVRRTVGVDNVCERSALCLARRYGRGTAADAGYRLIVEKQAQDGVTVAVAEYHPKCYQW